MSSDMVPDCYCACHSPVASRAWCEHCKGDNEVLLSTLLTVGELPMCEKCNKTFIGLGYSTLCYGCRDKQKLKVYIVERQDCDDTFIEGVFSTFENAEAFCLKNFENLYKNKDQNHYIFIFDEEVDKWVNKLKTT